MKGETVQWTTRIPLRLNRELLLVKEKHPALRSNTDVAIFVLERGLDAIAQEIMETTAVQQAVLRTADELGQIKEGLVIALALLNSTPESVIDRSQVERRKAEVRDALKRKGIEL
jgi:hypothetical protein